MLRSEDMLVTGLRDRLEELRLEYLNSTTRITFTRDIPKLIVSGQVFEDVKKGSIIYVKQWLAQRLVEMNVAEWADKPPSLQQLMQLEWREKNNPLELQSLPRYFYMESKRAASISGDERIREMVKDIMTLRMAKIIQFAVKKMKSEVAKKLTPEEELLYNYVSRLVEEWERGVMG